LLPEFDRAIAHMRLLIGAPNSKLPNGKSQTTETDDQVGYSFSLK
jgi:hypothetical protein